MKVRKAVPRDTPLLFPLSSAAPSPSENRILDAAVEIYGGQPDNLSYLHTVLAQCGLPYRRPPRDARDYTKENGRTTMILTSGHLLDPKTHRPILQGLPFGAKPRLLMIHLCTRAKITKSAEVEVAQSMSAFMQSLGIAVTGGKTGSIGRFKEQLNRLAATRMQLLYYNEDRTSMVNASSAIGRYDVFFPKDPAQKILWPSTITLSSDFFRSLMDQNAMPLDSRAVRGLQQSAMALDIYTWLAHRLCRIPNRQPVSISWSALQKQFGPEYKATGASTRAFRQDFKHHLMDVLALYRDAKVSFDHNGIIQLRQSPSPVTKTQIRGR